MHRLVTMYRARIEEPWSWSPERPQGTSLTGFKAKKRQVVGVNRECLLQQLRRFQAIRAHRVQQDDCCRLMLLALSPGVRLDGCDCCLPIGVFRCVRRSMLEGDDISGQSSEDLLR